MWASKVILRAGARRYLCDWEGFEHLTPTLRRPEIDGRGDVMSSVQPPVAGCSPMSVSKARAKATAEGSTQVTAPVQHDLLTLAHQVEDGDAEA